MIRTFIALEIPYEELHKIIQIRDEVIGVDQNIRWEPIEKLHLTLKFMGDTDETNVPLIKDEIQKIVSELHPIKLSFSKFGIFKKQNELKILWIGLNDSPELNFIVEKIENSFTKFGYPKEERKFKAHITLLRFNGHENKNKILKLLEASVPEPTFGSTVIHLFKSELKPTGSVYTSLQKFILNK